MLIAAVLAASGQPAAVLAAVLIAAVLAASRLSATVLARTVLLSAVLLAAVLAGLAAGHAAVPRPGFPGADRAQVGKLPLILWRGVIPLVRGRIAAWARPAATRSAGE